jgi:hypothetical protein
MTVSITILYMRWHFAECRHAVSHNLMIIMLNVIMLSFIMLNVIMLNVIMLSAVMLNVAAPDSNPQSYAE